MITWLHHYFLNDFMITVVILWGKIVKARYLLESCLHTSIYRLNWWTNKLKYTTTVIAIVVQTTVASSKLNSYPFYSLLDDEIIAVKPVNL